MTRSARHEAAEIEVEINSSESSSVVSGTVLSLQLDPLLSEIKKTAVARFKASNRLSNNYSFSSMLLVGTSLGGILYSLSEPFGIDTGFTGQGNQFISTIYSIGLIATSILINSLNFKERALSMHNSGKSLNWLYKSSRKYGAGNEPTESQFDAILQKYREILDKSDNHDPIDYTFVLLSDPRQYIRHDSEISFYLKTLYHIGKVILFRSIPLVLGIAFALSPFVLLWIYGDFSTIMS